MLAAALAASRHDSLATFAAFERALPGLLVPQRDTLNPPLWELGHLGWFQEYWVARNPQRASGARAEPLAPRTAGIRRGADALYDSSRVAHAARWRLPLPNADATRADLAEQQRQTLALLREAVEAPDRRGRELARSADHALVAHGNHHAPDAVDADARLYFFRLVLLHEDMHHEAALYTAHDLGVPITDRRWQPRRLPDAGPELVFDAGPFTLGHAGPGFAFDNERSPHRVLLPATCIDCQPLRWAEYLPFVEAGGYRQPRWWSEDGARWLQARRRVAPQGVRRDGDRWLRWRHGRWSALDPALAACHVTAHEAEAWCRWAGRRLPGEAEWERAATLRPDSFLWGDVWEWTASPFMPYPGFETHPYGDYSAPWFGSRRVLRGASFMTQPRMKHARYRNFFRPDRADVASRLSQLCPLTLTCP